MTDTTRHFAIEFDAFDPSTQYLRPVRMILETDFIRTPLVAKLLGEAARNGTDIEITENPEDVCECSADLGTCRPWAQCDNCFDTECARRDKEAQTHGDDSETET